MRSTVVLMVAEAKGHPFDLLDIAVAAFLRLKLTGVDQSRKQGKPHRPRYLEAGSENSSPSSM